MMRKPTQPTPALRRNSTAVLFLGLIVAGCSRPPDGSGTPNVATTTEPVAQSAPTASAPTPETTLDAGTAGAQQSGTATAPEPSVTRAPVTPPDPTPVLLDEHDEPLPQTDERPSTDSPAFAAFGQHLFDAILQNDPELAMPFFFPRVAYRQVKAIADPDRDWERRLVAAYERDIKKAHRSLRNGCDGCRFLRIDVPESGVKWMKPHSEGNLLGYYRVLRSRLVYLDDEEKERHIAITSMISWRGEWYVVHLTGFR